MISSKYLSLALVLLVLGTCSARSYHSRNETNDDYDDGSRESGGRRRHDSSESMEDTDAIKVKGFSGFKISVPLFRESAESAPTKTCNVSSCMNNGTLVASKNGTCPTCQCNSNCKGARCETCSPVSTTPIPTTNPAPTTTTTSSTISCGLTYNCKNGGTLVVFNSVTCMCLCPIGYSGTFCETLY